MLDHIPRYASFLKIAIILLLSGYFLHAFTQAYSQSSRRWLGSIKTFCSLENFPRLDKDKKGLVKEQICASRIE